MKQWLRRYLGFEELNNRVHELQSATSVAILNNLRSIDNNMKILRERSLIAQDASVRCLAILEPQYATAEDDPTRKKASDELGEKIQAKLRAEDLARKHATGEA